jgi:hypothetical protein
MSYHFELSYNNYKTTGKIWFEFNNKEYTFVVGVYAPDCDDYKNEINAHYFSYGKINDYGAKEQYTEYVNCFENLALNIDKKNLLMLFDLNINREFEKEDKPKLKALFQEINKHIIEKVKLYFRIKTSNNEKVIQTIAFLEKLLGEVEDNDQLFKKIGDFIKYLEE